MTDPARELTRRIIEAVTRILKMRGVEDAEDAARAAFPNGRLTAGDSDDQLVTEFRLDGELIGASLRRDLTPGPISREGDDGVAIVWFLRCGECDQMLLVEQEAKPSTSVVGVARSFPGHEPLVEGVRRTDQRCRGTKQPAVIDPRPYTMDTSWVWGGPVMQAQEIDASLSLVSSWSFWPVSQR